MVGAWKCRVPVSPIVLGGRGLIWGETGFPCGFRALLENCVVCVSPGLAGDVHFLRKTHRMLLVLSRYHSYLSLPFPGLLSPPPRFKIKIPIDSYSQIKDNVFYPTIVQTVLLTSYTNHILRRNFILVL